MDEEAEDKDPVNWRPWVSWAVVAPVVIWAIARTFGLERGFPTVQLMAYTPYVLLLSLVILLAVVLLRQWLAFAVGILAFIALSIAVVPRELGGPDEVSGGRPVNVMTFNLARGRADLGELRSLVESRNVDILALQEVTPEAVDGLKEIRIGQLLGNSVVATEEGHQGRFTGGAIFSRYPLEDLGQPATYSRQPDVLVSIPGAIPFRLRSVHPMAPAGPRTTTQWADEFDDFPSAAEAGSPWVLAGDFNATLDHQKLRDVIGTGFRDAADVMGLGIVSTWPSSFKWPLPVTLDHVLADDSIAITGYDVEAISKSDHRAVFADLVIPDR